MSIKTVDIEGNEAPWARTVRDAVGSLRYGSVEIVVHDGRVVQVETREKVRFPDDRPPEDRRHPSPERRADRNPGGTATSRSEDHE
jgi:hypothetical protein